MRRRKVAIPRRAVLAGAISTVTTACIPRQPHSGEFPANDLTFIIPNAAGGSNDLYGRFLALALERRLHGASVVPLNVSSGGGGKGIMQLFRAPADGYTIGILSIPGIFMLKHIRRLPQEFTRFSWLCSLTSGEHYGLAVPAHSPVHSLEELRALSRRRPVLFSATGPESTAYSATIISSRLLGIRSRIVSGYRGSTDYVMGAIRGDTDAVVTPLAKIESMRGIAMLRLLASFEAKSSFSGVPDATSLGLPDLASITVKRVLAAPPGLADPIRRKLSEALLQCAHDEAVRNYAHAIGEKMNPVGAEQTTAFVFEQQKFLDRWQSVIDHP